MMVARKQDTHDLLSARPNACDWPVFVCRQGVFLHDPRDDEGFLFGPDLARGRPGLVTGQVLLPPCRLQDERLSQPPLGIRLTEVEATRLIDDVAAADGALAATDYGPSAQDKCSNQDFALAATLRIEGPAGLETLQFAAVADGVSTKTFWPERAARIAVIEAWRVARRHVEEGRGFTHAAFALFREALASALISSLRADRAVLQSEHVTPPGWDRATFRRFCERDELWYNSTLLVALVGAEGGFVLSCGDGGIVVRKIEDGQVRTIPFLESTDEVTVSGVVSLAQGAIDFKAARITMPPRTELQIVLASDGVDRPLQRAVKSAADGTYGADFREVRSSAALAQVMAKHLADVGAQDIDNVSAAMLRWPIPEIGASIGRSQAKLPHPRAVSRAGESHIIAAAKPADVKPADVKPTVPRRVGLQASAPHSPPPHAKADCGDWTATSLCIPQESNLNYVAKAVFVTEKIFGAKRSSDAFGLNKSDFAKVILYIIIMYNENKHVKSMLKYDLVERVYDREIVSRCNIILNIKFEDIDEKIVRYVGGEFWAFCEETGFLRRTREA